MNKSILNNLFNESNKYQIYALRGINQKYNIEANRYLYCIKDDIEKLIKESFDIDEDRNITLELDLYQRDENKNYRFDLIKNLILLETLKIIFFKLSHFNFGNSLVNLKKLDLSHNNYIIIPKEICELNNLCVLNMSYNKIEILPFHSFDVYNFIEKIDLSYNLISGIPETIKRFRSLQKLNLQNNLITDLPMALKECIELKDLNLRNNLIEEIPDVIDYIPNLKYYNEIYVQLCKKRKY